MEKGLPLYVTIPLILALLFLTYLYLFVLMQQEQIRLCLIGIWIGALVYNAESKFWTILNLAFLSWNLFWLAMLLWGNNAY